MREIAAARRVLVPRQVDAARAGAAGAVLQSLAGRSMGTSWSVKFAAPRGFDAAPLRTAIEAVLRDIVMQMSPWENDSEVSRFNRGAPGSWHPLSADFVALLAYALQAAEDSGGACDPTCGALVELWGFGPSRRPADAVALPSTAAIEAARAGCGFDRIVLDVAAWRARQPGGMKLDFSAIAKGHAVDRVSRLLALHGLPDHLVEIGGELRGAGMRPDGQPWWVALEAPGDGVVQTLVALHGLSVATSGDYLRAFEAGGKRYSHTIDPRTGWPIDHGIASVSVLHPDCRVADAQSTALTVLGWDAGFAHAERQGLAARLVRRRGSGFEERVSTAYAAML